MQYLHTMVRVRDLDQSLDFYCNKLGLSEVRRYENEKGRFTLVFLAAPADVARVRELFAEYARIVDQPCCFVDFERELATLPGDYRLFLAEGAAGCVALRSLDRDTAEMKRLYVRAAHRGQGIGRALAVLDADR